MTFGWGSEYSLFTHLLRMTCTVVATGLVVFVACFCAWQNFAGGGWRGAVPLQQASYGYSPDDTYWLGFGVNVCFGEPKVTQVRETDDDVEVKVIAFTRPFHGSPECADGVVVHLQDPLGDRIVIDGHTGQRVSVRRHVPFSVEETRPAADWRLVKGPEWPSRRPFSLQLPPGWEMRVLEGIGPNPGKVVGEIVGDGARLEFDFGGRGWSSNPNDGQSLDYGEDYEKIGGVGASLLVSMDPDAGYTGAFFHQKFGPHFHIVGEGLTREQQRIAVTVFRTIRLPLPDPRDIIDENPPPPEGPPLIDDPSSR